MDLGTFLQKATDVMQRMAEQAERNQANLISRRESEVRRLERKGANRTAEEDERLMNLYIWLNENGNG